MRSPAFKKGEYVVYGDNGICSIEDVKEMQAAADTPTQLYYILKPVNAANCTLYVPVHNLSLCGKMRYILSKEKIDALLSDSRNKEIEWIEDKNERAAYFRDILKSGLQENLVLLIQCIYLKSLKLKMLGRKLPIADENVLKRAEKLVREEFSYALSIEPEAVGPYIRAALGIEDK